MILFPLSPSHIFVSTGNDISLLFSDLDENADGTININELWQKSGIYKVSILLFYFFPFFPIPHCYISTPPFLTLSVFPLDSLQLLNCSVQLESISFDPIQLTCITNGNERNHHFLPLSSFHTISSFFSHFLYPFRKLRIIPLFKV